MKIKSIVILLACLLLLSGLTVPAIACCEEDPPGDPICYVCEDGAWVLEDWAQCGQDSDCDDCYSCENCYCDWDCTTGQCCDNDDCVECPDCGDCESCNTANCECECKAGSECDCPGKSCSGCCECESCSCADKNDNCTGECHNGCSGCSCVDDESKCPGECDTCDNGTCTDHDYLCSSIDCEICNEGVCEDECIALGKHCWYGSCVECRDILDCEICEECIGYECVHPCDDCDDWPQYCVNNCVCKSCSLGDAALSPCSESQEDDYKCPECTIQTTNPCSNYSMRDYAGETIIYLSCTGSDCEPIEELCYTEYDCTTGDVKPLELCSRGDMAPPAPKACLINLDFPSWCWPCEKDSTDEGTPSNVDSYECPS